MELTEGKRESTLLVGARMHVRAIAGLGLEIWLKHYIYSLLHCYSAFQRFGFGFGVGQYFSTFTFQISFF
jgi:hypothetical protein